MTRISLFVLLCLLAGMAYATFELKDPAANVYEGMPDQTEGEAQPKDTAPLYRKQSGAAVISRGIGKTACGDFVTNAEVRSRLYLSGLYFVQGFIDGAGYQQLRFVGEYGLSTGHDAETIEDWIHNYCSEHPNSSIAQAAGTFVDERS